MTYEHCYYRTSDGSLDIEFLLVDRGASGWRAYILSPINYKKTSIFRSDDISVVHRLTEFDPQMIKKIRRFKSGTGLIDLLSPIKYICWKDKVPTLEKMRQIAGAWSEITAYYIKNGGNFSDIQKKLAKDGKI